MTEFEQKQIEVLKRIAEAQESIAFELGKTAQMLDELGIELFKMRTAKK